MFLPKVSASFFSRLLIFVIPLLLAVYWPAASKGKTNVLLAIHIALLLCSALIGMLWLSARHTRVEMRWAALFSSYFGLMLISSLTAVNPSRSLYDWVRVVLMLVVCFGIGRALRNKGTSQALGSASIAAALFCAAFIVYLYLNTIGPQIPTYAGLRIFKGLVTARYQVALNPLASSSVFLCIISLATLKARWQLYVAVSLVFLIAATMTGSRAPSALLLGSFCLLAIANLVRSRLSLHRFMGWSAAILIALSVAVVIPNTTELELSAVTEGRYDLWTVAWDKFLEHPLTGSGAESWEDDFASRLPNFYKDTRLLKTIKAGGYHDEYLTLLAEEGIFCFSAAMFIFWFLLRDAFTLTFHPLLKLPGRQPLLLGSIFLVLRALIEVPGIFGYGDDIADYLSYLFIGVLISRQSMLEHCLLEHCLLEHCLLEQSRLHSDRKDKLTAREPVAKGSVRNPASLNLSPQAGYAE